MEEAVTAAKIEEDRAFPNPVIIEGASVRLERLIQGTAPEPGP